MKRREVVAFDRDGDEELLRLTPDRTGVERKFTVLDGRPASKREEWAELENLSATMRSPSEFRAVAILVENPYV